MYEANGGSTQIGLLDFDADMENIQYHTLPISSGHHIATTLFTSMGIVYSITATYEPSQIIIQSWNHSTMNFIQTMEMSADLQSKLQKPSGYIQHFYDSNFMLSVPFTH